MKNSKRYVFHDYQSFDELYADRMVFCGLIELYREIFSEPGPWREEHSFVDVFYALKTQLAGQASVRICKDTRANQVVGFCWAQLLQPEEIYKSVTAVQYCEVNSVESIEESIQKLVDDKPMVFLHDLGIRKEYRGRINIGMLIAPVLDCVAEKSGTRTIFFWTVAQTCVKKLARRASLLPSIEYGDFQFFSSELPPLKQYYLPIEARRSE